MRALIAEAGTKDQAGNPISSGAIDPRADRLSVPPQSPGLSALPGTRPGYLMRPYPTDFSLLEAAQARSILRLICRLAGDQ